MLNFKKNPIILGTILLSFSGLICRGIGFFYRLFISQAFGEEAMGIFQLISPVLMLAFSLTCAGTQTAISKYTASCLGMKKESLARKFLFVGCTISLFLSSLYSIIVFCLAENISIHFLLEKRCAPLLRICALSFPFSALHSCFNGYFYGKKNTKIPSFTQITEQVIRVGSVFSLYHFFLSQNKVPTIALTCIGMVLGEATSFLISFLYYILVYSSPKSVTDSFSSNSKTRTTSNNKHHSFSQKIPSDNLSELPSATIYKETLHIACQLLTFSLPLTFNRVIVNLLQSYEAVSIPQCLRAFGYSDKTALSIYGVLTGMAFSLVMFPSTFANSVSVLLLPTVSEASSEKKYFQIRNTIQKSVFFSLSLGFACTLFFLLFGNFLGNLLFASSLAGTFICQLSFLCPFLYLHITLGSILNGLKRIKTTLFINIFALLIRLFFILYLIPSYGIKGYLWGLLLSELLSSFCCLLSLKQYICYTKNK